MFGSDWLKAQDRAPGATCNTITQGGLPHGYYILVKR